MGKSSFMIVFRFQAFSSIPAIIFLSILAVSDGLSAEQPRRIRAVKTDTPPIIDGKIDDACWALADIATGFTDRLNDKLALEQTLVRLLYDDENIYAAFECLEPEPDKILASERKYDYHMYSDDRISLYFDTFLDRRSNYFFCVNTLGNRYDARRGLFSIEQNWNCDWSAACTVADDRWFAELAVPISEMHFIPEANATWGINFSRMEKAIPEKSYWSYNTDVSQYARNFGLLTGLDLSAVKVDTRPRFETYFSSTSELKGVGTGKLQDGKNELNTGLDVAMRLNSQWVSSFTINPDFGQVEADADTIELRDTERFLKEKRAFFQEGAELFRSPLDIYYSRRFSDIKAAAKVTGQGRKWAVGLIDIEGEIERDDELVKGNYHVGRAIAYLDDYSHVGAMWTNSNRKDGSSSVAGIDSTMYLDRNNRIEAQLLRLNDSKGIETDDSIDHDAHAMYFGLKGNKKPLEWVFSYRDISRGFLPDLGYIPRRDIKGPGAFVEYEKHFEKGPFKWIEGFVSANLYEDHNKETILRDFVEMAGVCLRNEWQFEYRRADKYHAPYKNRFNRFKAAYNQIDKWNSIAGIYERGEYEDEPYDEFGFEKPFKPLDRLTSTIDINYRIKRPDGTQRTEWLWRWVNEYVFPWDGRIKFTAEDTAADRYNLTLLFTWPVKHNIDFYLMLSDYRTDEETGRSVFTKIVYRF